MVFLALNLRNINDMTNYIKKKIKGIHEAKIGHDPRFATFKELMQEITTEQGLEKHSKPYMELLSEVKEILNLLHRDGLLKVGDTLNDKYLILK